MGEAKKSEQGSFGNSGYVFRNKNKASDKQPDWRGKATVNGKEMLVSVWTKQKDGEEMLSLAFTDPSTLPARAAAPGAPAPREAQKSSAPAPGAPSAQAPAQKPHGMVGGDDGMADLDDLLDDLDLGNGTGR